MKVWAVMMNDYEGREIEVLFDQSSVSESAAWDRALELARARFPSAYRRKPHGDCWIETMPGGPCWSVEEYDVESSA